MTSLFILSGLTEPGVGLIFWTSIVFLLLVGILGKFAWKPILSAIKTREQDIEKALASAERALKDMRELKPVVVARPTYRVLPREAAHCAQPAAIGTQPRLSR